LITLTIHDLFTDVAYVIGAQSKEISFCLSVHIAENKDRDDPDYLFALERETAILQKRIEACKSRIMIVTCFDVTSG